jgi:hypothetical protein
MLYSGSLSLSRTMANTRCASYEVGCRERLLVRLLGPSPSSFMLYSGSFRLSHTSVYLCCASYAVGCRSALPPVGALRAVPGNACAMSK